MSVSTLRPAGHGCRGSECSDRPKSAGRTSKTDDFGIVLVLMGPYFI